MRIKPIHLMLLALLASSLACTQFSVVNQSQRPASVQVRLPDGSNNMVLLGPEGSRSWFVLEGGPYQVSVVPAEGFVAYMKDIQASTLAALITGEVDGAYERFIDSETDPITAFTAYMAIQVAIDGELQGATCEGQLAYTDLEDIEFQLAFAGADTETVTLNTLDSDASWTCAN